MGSLDRQVAIITGAGSGIGLATAKILATQGARVICTGRRIEPLQQVVDEIAAARGTAVTCQADMEKGDEAAGIARFALETYGQIDILVNNAGHSSRSRTILEVAPDDWESVFKANVEGVYRLTQAVLPDMLTRNGGTVITISSSAAYAPGFPSGPAYGASKASVHNLMRCINAELRDQGIRACTIFPGEVDTPIMDKRPHVPRAEARAMMMRPEDIAHAILFCASMPARTLVEEMVMMPTRTRDVREDIR
ncbi:MAG: SDR family oxidoreductase [Dehalococcoidia bacterium]